MPSGGTFDLPALRARLADLEVQMQQPGFWERPDAARQVSQEVARIRARMEEVERLERELADLLELAELASADDAAVLADLEREVRAFGDRLDRIERATLLRGEHDARNAILSIHAGAGGTESQDWVEMLLRMYLRWAEEHGYRTEIVDVSPGEEAGLKSVTVIVSGPNAYGYLRGERGVHRLVRLSPFDAAHRRHTSFALVDVIQRWSRRRWRSGRKTCAWRPSGPGAPEARTSTRWRRPCGSRTSPPGSWSSARTSAPSTPTSSRP